MGLFGGAGDRERKNQIDNLRDDLTRVRAEIVEQRAALSALTHQASAAAAKKWQYAVVENLNEEELNQLGAAGWEMVGVASYTVGWSINGDSSMKVHLHYALKRPVVEAQGAERDEQEVRLEQLLTSQSALKQQIIGLTEF